MADRFMPPSGALPSMPPPRGLRLKQLIDVSGVAPTNGYALTWDSATGKWKPAQVAAAGIADGSVTYVKLNADVLTGLDPRYVNVTGDTMTGDLTLTGAKVLSANLGNRLGALGATIYSGALPDTDASVQLYRLSSTNWAGIGVDGSGNLWFRTGLSGTPAARFVISASGTLGVATTTAASVATLSKVIPFFDIASGTTYYVPAYASFA